MIWLINRLKEPSTWASIAAFSGVIGSSVSPTMPPAAIAVTVLSAGLGFILKDKGTM